MTSRDRVLAAIAHQETDRVPVGDMGFFNLPQIAAALGMNAEGYEAIMQRLGLDIRGIGAYYIGPAVGQGDLSEPLDEWGGSLPGAFTYGNYGTRPLAAAESVADIENYPWPSPDWFDYAGAANAARGYDGRYALRGPGWHPIYCRICELMGMERALENLAWRPELIEAAVDRLERFYLEFHPRFLDATAGLLDIFNLGDDFAHDKGLMINPATWRRIFKPVIARAFAMAKARGLRTWFHCCGAIREIIPDMIEIGLDVLEPCQVHLPGMAPEELKREFGKDLTFFGAINTQNTLPFGTPDDVRAEVRERVRVLGEGGGYIVSSDHSVMVDVPVENVLAMYEAAGSYVG
jgi:uroporphyrinogen decarboxylase